MQRNPPDGRIFHLRIPPNLEAHLRQIADRDANPVSATMRRLLAVAVRAELAEQRREGEAA
jgi:hypothetical protein